MDSKTVRIRTTFAWIIIYLIVCGIIPTIIDMMIWRKLSDGIAAWLNLLTLIVFNCLFLLTLIKRYQLKIGLLRNISLEGILWAFGCGFLFYLLLDQFLDPFFDRVFVVSADEYRRMLAVLRQFPLVTFIRVCLLVPVVEEILIRGCILKTLHIEYGAYFALLFSAVLFAVLHFNFVQTLSAFICGLLLGLLYIKTGSLFSCILAHSLYNTISYFSSILV